MKLLVTGAWNSAHEHITDLEKLGHQVVFMQNESDPLPVDPQWVEGLVCNGLFLHHPIPPAVCDHAHIGQDRLFCSSHGCYLFLSFGAIIP